MKFHDAPFGKYFVFDQETLSATPADDVVRNADLGAVDAWEQERGIRIRHVVLVEGLQLWFTYVAFDAKHGQPRLEDILRAYQNSSKTELVLESPEDLAAMFGDDWDDADSGEHGGSRAPTLH